MLRLARMERPTLLLAPDGGLPGIPGSGPSGGGLPGIPGSGPTSGSQQPPAPQPSQPQPAPGGQPTFERPQQPEPGLPNGRQVYELAGWGTRLAAYLLDGVLLAIIFVPLIAIAGALGLDAGSSTSGDGGASFSSKDGQFLVLILVWLIAVVLYAPVSMVTMDGSTPGKRMLGIKVVRADGQPVTFGFAFLREVVLKGFVLYIVSLVTFGLGSLINYLWPLWDSENRALHDMAAKSRVVRR